MVPEPTVTVSAIRESVSFALPVSEAHLPASLFQRIAGEASAAINQSSAFTPGGPERASVRPLSTPEELAGTAVVNGGAALTRDNSDRLPSLPAPEAQDDLRAIALRFGPQSREG